MDDGLSDLWPDPADDTVRTHEPGGGYCFEQVLRDECIHRGYACDVDDRDCGTRIHNCLKQVLHHDLRSRAIESAYQRHREDSLPQHNHRGGEFHHLLALPLDNFIPRLLVNLSCIKTKLIEKDACGPG